MYVRHLVHLFSIFSLHKLLLQNPSTGVLNIGIPRQGKAIVPSLIKCDWGLFLAVVQSCFESSVNALPWINVICGISQVAAGLLQCGGRQPENSRKHPTFTTACSHFLLFIYSQCRTSDHTHQPRPKGSPNHFSNLIKNTQGFPFLWQLLPGQCVTVYRVSFVPHIAQTVCPYSRQKENCLAHLNISKYPAANVCLSTRKVFLQKPYNTLRVAL